MHARVAVAGILASGASLEDNQRRPVVLMGGPLPRGEQHQAGAPGIPGPSARLHTPHPPLVHHLTPRLLRRRNTDATKVLRKLNKVLRREEGVKVVLCGGSG